MERIELVRGDITTLTVDAIVNAANATLLGGGGVDGAIHRAAGPELLEFCRKLNGCPAGEAIITPGFLLPARYVIHTVGPVWHGGNHGEPELLASCYLKSLSIARDREFRSIAFPNISTGVYRFPKKKAAGIALREIRRFIEKNIFPEKIIIVVFDPENFEIYNELLNKNKQ